MKYVFNHLMIMVIATAPLAAQIFTFTKVADTDTAVPGGNGNFSTFSNMLSVDELGNVAFSEFNGAKNNGIYLSGSQGISRVADLNTAIPGGTGNFTAFSFFGNGIEGGRLAFRGNGAGIQAGIYSFESGKLIKIEDTNSAIPAGSGKFTSFGTGYVDGMNFAFIGSGESSQQGLYVSNGSTIMRIADKMSVVPGIGGIYGWSAQVGFDQGNLAFWASITGGSHPGTIVGAYVNGGGLATLASSATEVPGVGSNFTGFSSPVDLSGSTVAFRGQYGTDGQGIYTVDLAGGAITAIADLSTPVPNGTGTFTQLQPPAISSGRVVFQGGSTNGSGIYVYQDSRLKKVIDTTDLLDEKAIVSLSLSENSLADDYLAFRANFADSSFGIYRTSFAPAVVVHQPDALVQSGTGPFIGNGVYNKTGASQSRTKTTKPGGTITFGISIQNDGSAAESFKVKATGLPTKQFTVTYFHGKSNITSKVVNGRYSTTLLAPGDSHLIKAKVKLKKAAKKRSRVDRLVKITSTRSAGKTDAVKFIVKRSR